MAPSGEKLPASAVGPSQVHAAARYSDTAKRAPLTGPGTKLSKVRFRTLVTRSTARDSRMDREKVQPSPQLPVEG